MKCPICQNTVLEHEKICPQCSWDFAEDASIYSVLFGRVQIEEYQRTYRAFRTGYHNQNWRPLPDDEWAEALTQSVMQMADPEKRREFCEHAERDFLGPWREELIREYGIDPEAEIGTYDYLDEEDENECDVCQEHTDSYEDDPFDTEVYSPNPNMPIYQWLNWQVRRPRNLKTVLGPALQIHNQKTGSRKKLIDEICDRIANGTFDNLYIGDYFDVTMPGGEKVRLILAGFDKAEKTHMDAKGNFVEYYAVVVPENCFEKKASMDKSFMGLIGMGYNDVYDYEGSYMYNEVLPGYADKLQRVLNNHILHRTDSKELNLLNHSHLFGDAPYIRCHPRYHGLPLFALHQDMVEAFQGYHGDKTCPYWLSDQMEAGYFRNNEGEMVAEYKKLGVRPYFCIG